MDISIEQGSVTDIATPLLAVNLFEGVAIPGGATGAMDRALGGLISQMIADGEFKGKLEEVAVIHTMGKIPAQRVAVVGLGSQDKFGLEAIRRASGAVLKKARELKIKSYHTVVHGAGSGGMESAGCAQAVVEGAVLASYGYREFKSGDEENGAVERMSFVEMDAGKVAQIERGVARGKAFTLANTAARDLSAAPSNIAPPEYLAERARQLAAQYGLDCRVMGPEEMEKLGMGAILAVGQGSVHPPRMIALKYLGDPGSQRLLAIVGKGITFDTGGISVSYTHLRAHETRHDLVCRLLL